MSQLSVRSGDSRKDKATGQLPLPRTMTLGPLTHAGSSLPGLVQMLAPSSEPQQAGMFSGHKGCALPDSGPQVLGTPSPQSGVLFCPPSCQGHDSLRMGSGEASPAQDPQALGTPPGLAKPGRL